jgi:hypothetical protein
MHIAWARQKDSLALHKAIEAGRSLVLLRGAESKIPQWRKILESGAPLDIPDPPYSRMSEEK